MCFGMISAGGSAGELTPDRWETSWQQGRERRGARRAVRRRPARPPTRSNNRWSHSPSNSAASPAPCRRKRKGGSIAFRSRHVDEPRVAADLAVLHEAGSLVGLEVDLHLLAAIRAGHEEFIHAENGGCGDNGSVSSAASVNVN